jgi:aspartate aminotransferase
MYDQIYWVLTYGGAKHVTPVGLVPEMAPVHGVRRRHLQGLRGDRRPRRLGRGPPSIISRMKDLIGHTGAWAPRAEQVASARFLENVPAMERYLVEMRRGIESRLETLHQGLMEIRSRGLPVSDIAPQGAIYLSVRFDLIGRKGIRSNEDIRKLLLERAGFADGAVPGLRARGRERVVPVQRGRGVRVGDPRGARRGSRPRSARWSTPRP